MYTKVICYFLSAMLLVATNQGCKSKGSGSESSEQDEQMFQNSDKVIVGVQTDAPPMNFYDRNNRPKGLDFEIAKLIFSQPEFGLESSSVEFKYDADSYDEILNLLRKEDNKKYQYDIVMGGLTYIDGDDPDVIFTEPYLDNIGYSLISGKEDNINNIKDLEYKRIGVIRDDPDVYEYATKILGENSKIVELSDEEDTWMQINYDNNTVNAFIYDFPFAATELANNPNSTLSIKVSNLPNSNLEYRIGVRRGNEKLRDKLNLAIAKVKNLPEYAKKLKVYLPTGNVQKIVNKQNLPTHTVQTGETLSLIAQEKLGDLEKWRDLQRINNIPNPHLISVGDVLIISEK